MNPNAFAQVRKLNDDDIDHHEQSFEDDDFDEDAATAAEKKKQQAAKTTPTKQITLAKPAAAVAAAGATGVSAKDAARDARLVSRRSSGLILGAGSSSADGTTAATPGTERRSSGLS